MSNISLIKTGDPGSFKYIKILLFSICEAISIRYRLLKLIVKSLELNLAAIFSTPSPLLGLLTDNLTESFVINILTPSLRSVETVVTLSIEFLK